MVSNLEVMILNNLTLALNKITRKGQYPPSNYTNPVVAYV